MVTEPADPQIDYWADNLEEELVEAEMDPPQAKAFARAFQLGMSRVLSVMATKEELLLTKQELQRGLDQLRAEIHREIDLLRHDLDRRFRTLYWIMAIGFSGMFALMAAILARL